MNARWGAFVPTLVFFVLTPILRADLIVNTSLSLTKFQIIPSSGTLSVLPGLGASAFTSVYDSLGGFDQEFNSVTDDVTSASSATGLASATGAASAPGLTAGASSGVSLTGDAAAAGTNAGAPYGALSGFFQITDPTGNQNPVNVTFTAMLSISQSLSADQNGMDATSEVVFNLLLPDIDASPFLSLDNPLEIGPGGSLSSSSTTTLSGTASMFTNTDYYVYVEADAESYGFNSTPEPSYGILSAILMSLCIFFGASHRKRTKATQL